MKLLAIAQTLNCSAPASGDDLDISSITSPELATSSSITFIADIRFRDAVLGCAAPAVIVKKGNSLPGKMCLEVDDPYLGYARVAQLFEVKTPLFGEGIHASAWVDASAVVAANVSVGPLSVLGAGCSAGRGTIIGASVVIEPGVMIGEDCRIDSGVIIRRSCIIGNRVIIESGTVIGSEGFGNAREGAIWVRIPSLGTVIVEDDVWIGAHCAIDRGALGPTIIGKGARLDNLIHVAHNVTIGEHTAMAAQVGISGSTKIGKRVIIAGQAGFVGHIEIGDDAFIGAQSGVSKSVEPGKKVTGYPARDFMTMRRIEAASAELPGLLKEIKKMVRKNSQE